MLKKLNNTINSLYDYLSSIEDRSFYLSILRLYVSFHIIRNTLAHYSSLHFLMGEKSILPIYYESKIILLFYNNYHLFIFVILSLSILFFFGIGKYVTPILLFSVLEIYNSLVPYILNGGDNILKFLLLYLIFIDSYKYFSISPIRFSNDEIKKTSVFCTNIMTYAILLHICLSYFIAGIEKLHSDEWFQGVAIYYILSLERFHGAYINKLIIQNGYLVNLFTYLVVLWEIYFPVLVWNKKLKLLMVLIGIMMHISIMITMGLYDFQILYIFCLGLFLKNDSWFAFINKIKLIYVRLRARVLSIELT